MVHNQNARVGWLVIPTILNGIRTAFTFISGGLRGIFTTGFFQVLIGSWFILPSAQDVAEVSQKWINLLLSVSLILIIVIFAKPLKRFFMKLVK